MRHFNEAQAHFEVGLRLYASSKDKWGIAECLNGIASQAVAQQPERGARLFGAAQCAREGLDPQAPIEHADLERRVAIGRAQLSEIEFDLAWLDGRQMSLEQTVAYALGTGAA